MSKVVKLAMVLVVLVFSQGCSVMNPSIPGPGAHVSQLPGSVDRRELYERTVDMQGNVRYERAQADARTEEARGKRAWAGGEHAVISVKEHGSRAEARTYQNLFGVVNGGARTAENATRSLNRTIKELEKIF